MRILHWVDCYPPYRGGTEIIVQRLAHAMAARGHAVAVATGAAAGAPDEESDQGVLVCRFGWREALEQRDPRAVLEVTRAVRAFKQRFAPDLVHVHINGASLLFHLQSRSAAPVPDLVTVHGGLGGLGGGMTSLLGRLFSEAAHVTGVSQAMVDEAVAIEPVLADGRSSVVFNGDDRPARDDDPDQPPYLLCSGRHVHDKGFDLAIAAMPAILTACPQARLVIASDGPESDALKEQVQALKLEAAVRFTGWIGAEALEELVARCTAMIVPSRWHEGFGLVALEAARAHRPVIASAIGGLPEVVRHGETGLIVPAHCADAIADAAIGLLTDPGYARRLGRAAAARAADEFSLSGQVDRFVALYRQVIADHGRR